jgi:hypothetical protein
MRIRVSRRLGFWELAPSADGEAPQDLATALDGGEARPAFALWDLSDRGALSAEAFAALVGASALLRLRGVRVFVAGQGPAVARYLAQLGMRAGGGRDAVPGAGIAVLRRLLARRVATESAAHAQAELDEVLDRADLDDESDGVHELYRSRKAPARSTPDEAAETPSPRTSPPDSLGEILIELGVLTSAQLEEALEFQRHARARGKLGSLLVRMGLVTDEQIFDALEEQYRRTSQRPQPSNVDWLGQARDTRATLLGNILRNLGILSSEGLERALREQWASGWRENLGTVLLRLGLVTRPQLFRALEKQAELKARSKRTAGALTARLRS